MKTPISNSDLEARCLSALMKGTADVYAATAAGLTREHFAIPAHKALFDAIHACACQKVEPETFAVYGHLATQLGNSPVSAEALAKIEELEPTSINRDKFVAEVMGLASNRKLTAALAEAVTVAEADAPTWADKWERVVPCLKAAQDCGAHSVARSLSDYVAEAKEHITSPRAVGLAGPFPGWDREAGQMRPGELTVLAARPGLGKTAYALQFAAGVARQGKQVLFFSLEMSGSELVGRLAKQSLGSRGSDRESMLAALQEIEGLSTLHIYESREVRTLAQIEARCRLHASAPGGLGLVVIDYLQLITPPADSRRDNRERQVADMSRELKLLAQSIACPVLLLAQLNRESEKQGRRPQLSDLRESGAIEQDADRVWFLFAPPPPAEQPLDSQADKVTVEIIQAKARNGPPWVIGDLTFSRPRVTFSPK